MIPLKHITYSFSGALIWSSKEKSHSEMYKLLQKFHNFNMSNILSELLSIKNIINFQCIRQDDYTEEVVILKYFFSFLSAAASVLCHQIHNDVFRNRTADLVNHTSTNRHLNNQVVTHFLPKPNQSSENNLDWSTLCSNSRICCVCVFHIQT